MYAGPIKKCKQELNQWKGRKDKQKNENGSSTKDKEMEMRMGVVPNHLESLKFFMVLFEIHSSYLKLLKKLMAIFALWLVFFRPLGRPFEFSTKLF